MAGSHEEGGGDHAEENAMTRPALLAVSRIFVNLPVQDLKKAIEFFTRVGFTFNPQFTDDTATCMIIGETIFAMLLTRKKFRTFTPYPLVDARRNTEVLVALQLDSRAQVDAILQKALAAGGRDFRPVEDHGWMYGRAFQDLDGHIWELFWMDPSGIK
jgi:predicted lactoylglutathione lyase